MTSLILAAALILGPVEAEVIRVLDGDTYQVKANTWLDTTVTTMVRLKGVDTPESGARAQCDRERELASKALDFVELKLPPGTKIKISNIEYDKYGGRVVANVLVGSEDLTNILINLNYAYPYKGGKKISWCK